MAYITLNDVNKTIKKQKVLDGVSLELEPNRIYGFVGKNGSGKTMLFRAICGLIRCEGTILVNGREIGKDVSSPPGLGLMIENIGLWPGLTGMQSLSLLAGLNRKIGKDAVAASIQRVGLDPADKRPFRKYSLGMKQRLVIAQAIMESPELLVLDEPTNALDAEGVLLFREIIREEKERGATVLIASHNSEDIQQLCDKIFFMQSGRLADCRAPEGTEG